MKRKWTSFLALGLSLSLFFSTVFSSTGYATMQTDLNAEGIAVSQNEIPATPSEDFSKDNTDISYDDETINESENSQETENLPADDSQPANAGEDDASPQKDQAPLDEIAPDTESPDAGAPGAENNEITITFYDSDKTTVLFSQKMHKGETLSNYFSDPLQIKLIKNGYSLNKWVGVTSEKGHSSTGLLSITFNKDNAFYAMWNTSPYQYPIHYEIGDGAYYEDKNPPSTFTIESEITTLPSPVREGYLFGGWYLDSAFSKAFSSIPKGTFIDAPAANDPSYTLYAKWISAKPAAPEIKSAKNSKKGVVKVTFKPSANAVGYEIVSSKSKTFKKENNAKTITSTTATYTNMPQNKTYYFKVRAYSKDSTGKKCYSEYGSTKSVKIKKGVTESKATSTSGKLKSVKIASGTDLVVKATVNKRLKSYDDSYYLVQVDPVSGKISKQVAHTDKSKAVTFRLGVKGENGINLIQGKYAVAIRKSSNKYMLISKASFITNPEGAATYTAPFPTAASKKGEQGSLNVSDGISHAFLNMDLRNMLGGTIPYQYNGKTYYFNDPWSGYISAANKLGLTITGQIMLSYTDSKKYMIVPGARSSGHLYYAMNAQEKKSREELEAAFSFMAERYSTDTCHLDNWILGNEVNIHRVWYYAGKSSGNTFMKNYADTFRILYYAVKSNSKNSRVYICTDHTWNNRLNDWGAKPFIESFNKQIKAQNKNIKWNLAFHAYPAVLTNAAVWNDNKSDRFSCSNSSDTEFVSALNLQVMTNYIKKNYGSSTRVIISEVGFTQYTGADTQAAALAYSYYKAEFNDMIDAFIIQTVNISTAENYSLSPEAQSVFRYMNTPDYEAYTNKYLGKIGASSWRKAIPGFDDKKLKAMPR